MPTAVRQLKRGEEAQTLDFLNRQPFANVVLSGFVQEHGLESPRNRGSFYGRFDQGCLCDLALIGHHVILSGSGAAIPCFAEIAGERHKNDLRMVFGEETAVDTFTELLFQAASYFQVQGAAPQLLYALRRIKGQATAVEGLRLARLDELEEVVELHARLCAEQSGVDPSAQDPAGFRQWVLHRFERGRIWVVRDHQVISFKTDVVTETDCAAYLEGVWTRPDLRGKGLGSAALKGVCQRLLARHQGICLYVDGQDEQAQSFYERVGFERIASYRVVRCGSVKGQAA